MGECKGEGFLLFFKLYSPSFKFPWKATTLVIFLFAFENMTFLRSGLALLDVCMVTFLLAAGV